MSKAEELVRRNENGQAITDSLLVAEKFKKQHLHVLRDIDNLKKDVSNFGLMFIESTYSDSYSRTQRMYVISKDGFTLLAMGFTGEKALKFKVDYINAFNQMETILSSDDYILMRSQEILTKRIDEERRARMIAEQNEQAANDTIKELKPKADKYDNISASENKTLTVKSIAKDFGMSDQFLNAILHKLGIQYKHRDRWMLYQKYTNKGYEDTDTTTGEGYREDSITGVRTKISWANTFMVWTHKGRLFIHEIIDPLLQSGRLIYKKSSWYLDGEKIKVR